MFGKKISIFKLKKLTRIAEFLQSALEGQIENNVAFSDEYVARMLGNLQGACEMFQFTCEIEETSITVYDKKRNIILRL